MTAPSPLHRAPADAKVFGAVAFLVAVVLLPRAAWPALGVGAALVVLAVAVARTPPRRLATRLAMGGPVLGFAALMPLFGSGRRVEVLGQHLYADGIDAGATLLAKGAMGLAVAAVLADTTPAPRILDALRRFHVPAALVLVIHLMLRYSDVLVDEARRMQLARQARGYRPRWLWQARGVAAGLGTLFVRSFERGERVHRAMAARGFSGTLPAGPAAVAAPPALALAALPALVVVATVVLA